MVESFFDEWKEEKKFKSLVSSEYMDPSCRHAVVSGAQHPFQEQILSWGTSGWQHHSSQVLGVQPQTYMNLSGDAVSALVSFYKLDPKTDILVISDDIDMEFGKVRYRSEGSHGGQNWLRDIIAKLASNEFARIKVGIGRDDRYEVSDWVLSKLSESEKESINTSIKIQVEEYIIEWLWD